ncbi:MAG: hypothetical protein CVU05_06000 [Bacteroidetes bacterium HGW-Bacteroidetes-21]|jgi:hypothetical protein|nr:MAG: hypothetical protein CVU05_06000 [Bacteroidetes bacterium HGW-Bacteroidetes-21]
MENRNYISKYNKSEIEQIIKATEYAIWELVQFFNKEKDFFFTEKELHSFFYHKCISSGNFPTVEGFNLVHAEYPTPFKLKRNEDTGDIENAGVKDKFVRGHIDLVVLNPNFVDFVKTQKDRNTLLSGVSTTKLYTQYIIELKECYSRFNKETNEPILLYAIEFKYVRYKFVGTNLPIKEIKSDIKKLQLIKSFVLDGESVDFCRNTKAIAFFGYMVEKNKSIFEKELSGSGAELYFYNKGDF